MTDHMSLFLRSIRDERIWSPEPDDSLSTKLSWVDHYFKNIPDDMKGEALQIFCAKIKSAPRSNVLIYFQNRHPDLQNFGVFQTNRYGKRLFQALMSLKTQDPHDVSVLDMCYTLPNGLSVRADFVTLQEVLEDAKMQDALEDITGVRGDMDLIVRRCCEFAHITDSESYIALMAAIEAYCTRRFGGDFGTNLAWRRT